MLAEFGGVSVFGKITDNHNKRILTASIQIAPPPPILLLTTRHATADKRAHARSTETACKHQ